MRHPNASWIGFLIAITASTAAAQVIERVSVSSEGVEGNGDSFCHLFDAVSADGRFVVFESDATNLVPADGNGLRDVFLRDRLLGTTTRVSEASGGGDASGESRYPSISEDGRWIAFTSEAADLVADDTNAAQDVFVFDRITGQIARGSMAWDGSEGNGDSRTPSISGDGRYVAFRSGATNMVSGARDSSKYIYVRDLQTGSNVLASVTWDGFEENGGSWYPHIAADGRHVVFISNSTNLVSFDKNGVNDAYIRDLDLGVTSMIGSNINGGDGNSNSGGYGLSSDGRYAGIFSNATDLLPPGEDSNAAQDAFVRDFDLGVTERVSVSSSGEQGNAHSGPATLDGSGRFAAFHSDASNLVDSDVNVATDIFGHDRATGITTLLTITAAGNQSNGDSLNPNLSDDGRFVVFRSVADNLVPDDTNGFEDVFVAVGPAAIGDVVRIIPGAASASGVGDAYFVTDVRLFNPSTESTITVYLSALKRNADNSMASEVPVDIAPRNGVALNDILGNFFGLTETTGAIRMRSDVNFLATSRTYNVGGESGTYGSYIPALATTDALTNGILLHVANNPADSGFRSNVGFANPGLSETKIKVKVFNADTGELLGKGNLVLRPRSFSQKDVFQFIGQKDLFLMNASIEFKADFPVLAYTTVIDNTSDDPICVLPFADRGTPP